ncbi:trace amine-associated receptor 13c-like [Diretmus argenteus]
METLEGAELCYPQLNTSCRRRTTPHSDSMLLYILLSSSSLITVFLNMLVIISISHFRQLHTPTNFLLLSLAVSDFLVGFLLMPERSFSALRRLKTWTRSTMTQKRLTHLTIMHVHSDIVDTLDIHALMREFISITPERKSIFGMVLISVDRYVAICDPLRYPTNITPRRVQICVILCWVCCVSYSGLILKDFLRQPDRYNSCVGECMIVINYTTGTVDFIVSFIGPVTVIIVLYSRVFVVAVSQARAMRSHVVPVTHRRSVTVTAKKSEMKAARTLGIVIAVFLVCYCPCYLPSLAGQDTSSEASYLIFLFLLLYSNSLLNPVIYAFFYPWFRKAIKLIVTLNILQSDSSEANVL